MIEITVGAIPKFKKNMYVLQASFTCNKYCCSETKLGNTL